MAAGMCSRVNCIPEPGESNWYTYLPARRPSYSSTIRSLTTKSVNLPRYSQRTPGATFSTSR